MSKVVGTVVGICMLVCIGYVVWRYKWYILCGVLAITLVLMGSNAVYRRCTGRDMGIYTRIMKEDK